MVMAAAAAAAEEGEAAAAAEQQGPGAAYHMFVLMEDLLEKLKLLNFEEEAALQSHNMRPPSRWWWDSSWSPLVSSSGVVKEPEGERQTDGRTESALLFCAWRVVLTGETGVRGCSLCPTYLRGSSWTRWKSLQREQA